MFSSRNPCIFTRFRKLPLAARKCSAEMPRQKHGVKLAAAADCAGMSCEANRSRQPVILNPHRTLVAGRVHADRGLRHLSPRRHVFPDLHIPRLSDEDRAVMLDTIELARVVS